ncbi:MAG: LytTR family DNA-binding domain-containing protein, partial [Bacteroidota bacterium]
LFLDIQMPEITGTEFAQLLSNDDRPKVVFTTAYSEYALKGFELSVLDYLLKPITFSRFLTAVEKFPREGSSVGVPTEHIVIKSGHDYHRVDAEDILYIESDSEYVHYHLESGQKIMAYQSLNKLVTSLPDSFLRVHRSYIVNGQKVSGLTGRELLIKGQAIPISDSYYEQVKAKLFQ